VAGTEPALEVEEPFQAPRKNGAGEMHPGVPLAVFVIIETEFIRIDVPEMRNLLARELAEIG
jgi:hypothetical protein